MKKKKSVKLLFISTNLISSNLDLSRELSVYTSFEIQNNNKANFFLIDPFAGHFID